MFSFFINPNPFLKKASIIPATAYNPPIIAQTCIRKDVHDLYVTVYLSLIGDSSYLKNIAGRPS